MSRPIQTGDIAKINDTPYRVEELTSQGILIALEEDPQRQSLLILKDDRWQVYGYDQPHEVTFEAAPVQFLTGILEMDQQILMNLDPASLFAACQTNQYAQALCSDDFFWKEKIQRDYGPGVIRLKPADISYQQQYLDIYNFLKLSVIQINPFRSGQNLDPLVEAVKINRYDLIFVSIGPPGRVRSERLYILITSICVHSIDDVDFIKWLHQVGYSHGMLKDAMMYALSRPGCPKIKEWYHQTFGELVQEDF